MPYLSLWLPFDAPDCWLVLRRGEYEPAVFDIGARCVRDVEECLALLGGDSGGAVLYGVADVGIGEIQLQSSEEVEGRVFQMDLDLPPDHLGEGVAEGLCLQEGPGLAPTEGEGSAGALAIVHVGLRAGSC